MPDPKVPKFRDFYPHEIWRFLSVFRLNPERRPNFIRTLDQALKKKFATCEIFLPHFAGHPSEVLVDAYISCIYVVSYDSSLPCRVVSIPRVLHHPFPHQPTHIA